MSPAPHDLISLCTLTPGGELRVAWTGTAEISQARHDSHVPDDNGGVLPIIEFHACIHRVDICGGAFDELVRKRDIGANELDTLLRRHDVNASMWLEWGGVYSRVKQWKLGYQRADIDTSTGCPQLATFPDGHFVEMLPAPPGLLRGIRDYDIPVVALSEPSPPAPMEQWLPAQRRAASDQLIAEATAAGGYCRPSEHVSQVAEPAEPTPQLST